MHLTAKNVPFVWNVSFKLFKPNRECTSWNFVVVFSFIKEEMCKIQRNTFKSTQTDFIQKLRRCLVLCFHSFNRLKRQFFQTLPAPPSLLLKQLLLIRVQSWVLKRDGGLAGRVGGWGGVYRGISDTNSFSLFSPPPLSLSFPLT